MAKVSICIPTYENPNSLERLLRSIFIQTYVNYEIIICDDSNNEDCKRVAKKFNKINASGEIRYIKNETKLGSPKNWNRAISLATGKYIKLMHHDDAFSRPESLDFFVSALEDCPECSFVASASTNYYKNKKTKENIIKSNIVNEINLEPEKIFLGNKIGSPSVAMWRNSNYHFDEDLIWMVDVNFYLSMLSNGNFLYIDQPLVDIYAGEKGQITKKCIHNVRLIISENLRVYSTLKGGAKYSKDFRTYWLNLFEFCNFKSFDRDDHFYLKEKDFLDSIVKEFNDDKYCKYPRIYKNIIKRLIYKIYEVF